MFCKFFTNNNLCERQRGYKPMHMLYPAYYVILKNNRYPYNKVPSNKPESNFHNGNV